jgi:hypothetical protein
MREATCCRCHRLCWVNIADNGIWRGEYCADCWPAWVPANNNPNVDNAVRAMEDL